MGNELKRCPFCAEEIQAQAVKCKHCGMMLSPSPTMMPPPRPVHGSIMRVVRSVLLVLTAVMVFGMIAICAGVKRTIAPTAARTGSPAAVTGTVQDGTVEAEVTAEQLAQAYSANELAADNQFRGRWLRVRGRVESIDKDLLDEPKVTLRAKSSLWGVSCGFEDGWEAQLAGLKKNDDVVVRCLGKGMVIIPLLESCALEAIQR